MKKIVVPIKGLHCKACEILTEDRLKEIKNIRKVSVSQKTGLAEISYKNEKPNIEELGLALKSVGYSLGDYQEGEEPKENTSKVKKSFSYYLSIFASIIIIYWLLGQVNMDMGGLTQGNFSAPMAILIGLVAGVSTCLALVGGLVLSVSANYAKKHPNATRAQKVRPQIIFNLGRFVGFFVLGGLLGLLGSAFKISTFANSIITIVIGLVIIILGFKLLEMFPSLNKFDFSLPKKFGKIVKINDPFLLGVLTFFLPCGFTQAMQVYAIGTGDFMSGAVVMSLFALGTMPGILGIGSVSALFNKKQSKTFFVLAGIVVVAFGIFNLSNGYRLFKVSTGANLPSFLTIEDKKDTSINKEDLEIVDGTRIIRMVEHNRGYSPNYFVILKDQPVKWIIDAQAPYSCASALVVPSLNIQTQLKAGENVFEFTPKETGEIRFSCSMGMYAGKFVVVEDESKLK